MNWGPVPFKVFNSWLRDEELNMMLDRQLSNLSEDSNSNIHMILKSVQGSIKDWSRQNKNNFDVKIKEVEKCINDVDNGLGHSRDLAFLNSSLEELYEQKVSMLKQKARATLALKETGTQDFIISAFNGADAGT